MNAYLCSRISTLILITGLIPLNSYSVNDKEKIIIACTSALAGGIVYGHIILPWHTQSKQKRITQLHIQEKEHLLTFCQKTTESHANASIPQGDSRALSKYKEELLAVLVNVEKALEFKWDNNTEKEFVLKLKQALKDKEAQLNKLLGLTTGQEVHAQYKEELALIHDRNPDSSKIDRLVGEKYGNRPYKFTTYKTMLNETIAHCKAVGAPQETLQELEKLNKCTNFLFATSLAQERTAQDNAIRQEQLHNAELGNKLAIKDFYQAAQHQVETAEQTVSHFASEMDHQCRANKSLLENCSSLLQTISGIFASWSIHNEQQTERIVREVRQQGNATLDALKTLTTRTTAAERKAEQAQQQAKEAMAMAQTAIPRPPAFNPNYIAPGNTPEPSAPPMP